MDVMLNPWHGKVNMKLTWGQCLLSIIYNSVLYVKALVGAFNQEKALVGAFSVITNLCVDLRLQL